MTGAQVIDGKAGSIVVKTGDKEETIAADQVALAVGYGSDQSLYEALKYEIESLHVIGDARKVQNIMYAIWDAFEVASTL
jgi:2-enoate reductase